MIGIVINKRPDVRKIPVEKLIEEVKNLEKRKTSFDEKEIENIIEEAIKNLHKAVEDYKKGKTNAISALIGYVMKITKGKYDPILIRKLIQKKLED